MHRRLTCWSAVICACVGEGIELEFELEHKLSRDLKLNRRHGESTDAHGRRMGPGRLQDFRRYATRLDALR